MGHATPNHLQQDTVTIKVVKLNGVAVLMTLRLPHAYKARVIFAHPNHKWLATFSIHIVEELLVSQPAGLIVWSLLLLIHGRMFKSNKCLTI